jgi:hypothetical protein
MSNTVVIQCLCFAESREAMWVEFGRLGHTDEDLACFPQAVTFEPRAIGTERVACVSDRCSCDTKRAREQLTLEIMDSLALVLEVELSLVGSGHLMADSRKRGFWAASIPNKLPNVRTRVFLRDRDTLGP